MADSAQVNDFVVKRRQESFDGALERIRQVESSKRRALSLTDYYFLNKIPEELSKLTWLGSLRLPYGSYSDLSPIGSLVKLESLEVPHFAGKDLEWLQKLTNLAHLRIGSNDLEDISTLGLLQRLRTLFLRCHQLADLSPLSHLKELGQLEIFGSNGNLRPLESLQNLHTLSLASSSLQTLDGLASLKQLKALTIGQNKIADYSLIGRILGLTSLDLFVTATRPNLSWLGAMRQLRNLRFVSNQATKMDWISGLTQLETLTLGVSMQDLTPLANLTNLLNLDITGTGARNLTPLAHLIGLVVGAEMNRISGGLAYSSKEISDTAIRSIGNVGRLQRTRRVLDRVRRIEGLPALDEALREWARSPGATDSSWQDVLAKAKASPVGVKFVQHNEQLVIDPSGDATDQQAAENPITSQLHDGVRRRSKEFVPLAVRVNNQPAWQGIGDAAKRFSDAVDAITTDIPSKIGHLYDSIIELGSYLDLDQKLRTSEDASGYPLEPEIHRALSDLIRTAAPWVRRFPTAQMLDDEAGAFLTRAELYNPSAAVADFAEDAQLISANDAGALRQLVEAARRGEFQGQKAGTRVAASARNLILTAGTLATTFYLGAVSSDFATKSKLVMRAGTFLATSEESLLQLFSESPADIQYALKAMLDDIRKGRSDPQQPPAEYLLGTGPRLKEEEDDDKEDK